LTHLLNGNLLRNICVTLNYMYMFINSPDDQGQISLLALSSDVS